MKHMLHCLMTALLAAVGIHGMAEEPVEVLLREIRRTVEERDETRKELLRVESDSREALESLREERQGLSTTLERKNREILQLEAAVTQSARAAERARVELESKNRAIQELESEQAWMQRKYQQVLNKVQDLTTSATAEEVRALKQQREQMRRRLRDAGEELRALRGGRGAVAEEQSALDNMNRELTESLEAARRAESLSNAKLSALETRLGTLRDELSLQYEERSKLEQEKEQMEDTIGELRSDLANALENRVPRAEVDSLRDRLDQALAENGRLRDEIATTREIPDLREDFALVKRERDLLSAQKKTLNSKLDRVESSLTEERKARQRLTYDNKELRKRLREERDRSRELEKDIRSLKAGVAAAENAGIDAEALVSVRRLLEDMRQENRKLKNVVENQRTTVDDLMRELTEKENERNIKVRELQSMLGQQLNELAAAQKQVEGLKRTANELEIVRGQRETLIQRQKDTRRDMKVLASHIYDLRKKVRAGQGVSADLDRERKRSQALSQTLRDLRRELTSLERMQKVVSLEKRKTEDQVKRLRQQLRAREEREKSLEAEKLALERELRNLRGE